MKSNGGHWLRLWGVERERGLARRAFPCSSAVFLGFFLSLASAAEIWRAISKLWRRHERLAAGDRYGDSGGMLRDFRIRTERGSEAARGSR